MNDLPVSIHFPVGHPQANTLYIGHPFKPDMYIPFENSTEHLFMERVHELCYLGQCLGANEIRIKRIQGLNLNCSEASQLGISGDVSVKVVNVGEVLVRILLPRILMLLKMGWNLCRVIRL